MMVSLQADWWRGERKNTDYWRRCFLVETKTSPLVNPVKQ